MEQAVAADQWTDVGVLAITPATGKRPAAHYRVFETGVTLYGTGYRAIVVHSSAHDKRRHKCIERVLDEKHRQLSAIVKEATATEYFCQADARQAAEQLEFLAALNGSSDALPTHNRTVAQATGKLP